MGGSGEEGSRKPWTPPSEEEGEGEGESEEQVDSSDEDSEEEGGGGGEDLAQGTVGEARQAGTAAERLWRRSTLVAGAPCI